MLPGPVALDIAAYDYAAAARLERELGLSHVTAQVLVRRGLGDPAAAAAFLAAGDSHPSSAWPGLGEAAARILGHARRGARITVHGDYDADGVCSTAILVRALHSLGADVDWILPSRVEDGYGLSAATVARLAKRGTDLLVTADCAITAVAEVAAARAAGIDVVITDHHSPRADGALPDAAIVHPGVNGYPCPELCATGVAYKLAGALLAAAGEDPALADEDLDLVALATVADVVPLRGENRRLVRAGLEALARTRKPGLRELMAVSQLDPARLDAQSIAFRLAPRINAAGRIARADGPLELLLTDDPERARAVAQELDRLNAQRRDVETRIRFAAEAQAAGQAGAHALVLAGEDWHPGVVGIVAARIAERHHRPCVLVALDGDTGSGSGRSIPAFDLLGGLVACAEHLERYGGHRAAAGLTIRRDALEAFRSAFTAHAAAVLEPADLVPAERIDAVAPGGALGLELAEELERLAPFGAGNPPVSLLVPAARLDDPRPMGEGRHVAFTLAAGGARSRAVCFGAGSGLPAPAGEAVDAAVRLEVNHWNGTVEPRLVLRCAQPRTGPAIELVGEPESVGAGVAAELGRALEPWPPGPPGAPCRELRDARGEGIAGTVADLVHAGDSVLVVAAHAPARADALRDRLGGFALTSWDALVDRPELAAPYAHVVALDPPAHGHLHDALACLPGSGWTHLAWGEAELDFALRIHRWHYELRPPLAEVFRALRAAGPARGDACCALLTGPGPRARTPALAGRLVRVLCELGLARYAPDGPALELAPVGGPTPLEQSAAYRCYAGRLDDGLRWLTRSETLAA